jgi:hypothetical protein
MDISFIILLCTRQVKLQLVILVSALYLPQALFFVFFYKATIVNFATWEIPVPPLNRCGLKRL